MTHDDDVLDRSGHLTPLACERLAAELRDGTPDDDPSFTRLAREHYRGCAPCQAEVTTLAEPMVLPPLAAPIPLRAPERRTPRRAMWWGSALAVAAATLVAVFVATRGPSDDLRVKGGAFDFEVQRADGRVLGDGAEVRAGDVIYFAARVEEPAWVAIWGVDAHGVRYVVRTPEGVAPTASAVRLPQAIELDADGASETITARMCPARFEIDGVLASDCATRTITLRKVP